MRFPVLYNKSYDENVFSHTIAKERKLHCDVYLKIIRQNDLVDINVSVWTVAFIASAAKLKSFVMRLPAVKWSGKLSDNKKCCAINKSFLDDCTRTALDLIWFIVFWLLLRSRAFFTTRFLVIIKAEWIMQNVIDMWWKNSYIFVNDRKRI